MNTLTKQQARQFILLKQGLLGDYKFEGKAGVMDFIRQAGCIQYDPVNVCGKNADITLQARVKDYRKEMLAELLYGDRLLFDYPDKVLSIIPMEYWPYFTRYREKAKEMGKQFVEIAELEEWTKEYIAKHGHVSSKDLPVEGKAQWHSTIFWSGNWQGESNIARSVLEQLYSAGELLIHHKKGTRKYYDLTKLHVDEKLLTAEDPLPDDFSHQKWRVLRRIGAVGLLWDKNSDAWLNIWNMQPADRSQAIAALLAEEKIIPVTVEGMKETLYCRAEDCSLLKYVKQQQEEIASLNPRCEFLAPLDPFMWDRKLIKALFGFAYGWEIYTPPHKRKYGAYVMPVLYGEQFIGRIELIHDRKADTMVMKNIWYEDGVKQTVKLRNVVQRRVKQFAKFSECGKVDL